MKNTFRENKERRKEVREGGRGGGKKGGREGRKKQNYCLLNNSLYQAIDFGIYKNCFINSKFVK